MPTLAELKTKGSQQATEIRKLADKMNAEGYAPTAEDETNWRKANDDYNATLRAAEREEAAEKAANYWRDGDPEKRKAVLPDKTGGENRGAEPTDEERSLALQAWVRHQMDADLSDEQRSACERLKFNPARQQLNISLLDTRSYGSLQREYRNARPNVAADACERLELRTMSAFSGPSGAYLRAPGSLVRRLEVNMLAFGGVAQVAEVITTATGERMSWPTADDTGNEGEMLGENRPIGTGTDPKGGLVHWDAYKFSTKPVVIPYELLEDEQFDLPTLIGNMFGERLGRIRNRLFTLGTGASQPRGIVNAASLGRLAASATAIAADELFDLQHSVDPSYRTGAGWMMHDNIVLAIRKLKDGQGQYLWQSGIATGTPDRLLGDSLTINQHMASSIATGQRTILYGQLSKYKVRRVNGLRLYRLEERFRDNDQDGFIGFVREDGNLLDAGTAPIKFLQQA
jgi:HK97 family phage major capsid protein